MANWTQNDLQEHMDIYDNAGESLGKVTAVYEDSFRLQQGLLHQDRYLPYSAIQSIENHHLTVTLSKAEVAQDKWKVRPDYEQHLGDPTQLFYDRGHGVQDPFDEANPALQQHQEPGNTRG